MKSFVPPVPSWVGGAGGSFGSRRWYVWSFPDPLVFE